jgi:hypothetical protein
MAEGTANAEKNLRDAEIQLENKENYVYTGEAIEPDVSVLYEEQTLNPDTDYIVKYENNVDAGVADIIIEGLGDYQGTITEEFDIEPKDLSDSDIIVDTSNLKTLEFNGKDRTPIISLKYNGKLLNIMADFTAEYKNNFYPGTATILLEGIENFTGTLTKTFKISKTPIGNVTIRTEFDRAKQLVVSVNNGSYGMTKDEDYTYSVVTDSEGNMTITFQGIGSNYTGTYIRKIAAEDNPNRPLPPTVKKAKITEIKNKKGKKIKLVWNKLSGVDGYQIEYSTEPEFKKSKSKTIKKNSAKYTIEKLELKKKYYIRVRAYKVFQNKKYYGTWSKTKKIKIAK